MVRVARNDPRDGAVLLASETRRHILVVGVVVLVALAGCAGAPSGGEAETGTDDESTAGSTDIDARDQSTAGGDGGESEPGATDGGESSPDSENGGDQQPTGAQLEIHHIDVGQAESTLLVAPSGETMVIDTGDWRQEGEEVLAYLDARGIDSVDHLVTTHPHADHIGGHAELIEQYEDDRDGVGAVYDPGVAHTTQTYADYLDAIDTHDVDLYEVVEGDTIPFGDEEVNVTVLNPQADRPRDSIEANTMTLLVEFRSVSYLVGGDTEAPTEQRLASDWAEQLDADIYQVNHHGSDSSSSSPFLDAVDPEIAVISSAFDSQYGHPHDEVLGRLATRDVETYWTGMHGTVVVRTNGSEATVSVETAATTDPEELRERKPQKRVSGLVVKQVVIGTATTTAPVAVG